MRDGTLPFSRVLLLQGPAGPFFRLLARELRARGASVWKVNFNAGDVLYFPDRGAIGYRGRPQDWPDRLRRLIADRAVDAVALFGDSRPHHRQALEIAGAEGVPVFVFEEGYLRPDHVTVETGGVNGWSRLMREAAPFGDTLPVVAEKPEIPVGNTFPWMALHSTLYSVALDFGRPLFPYYRHRRPCSPVEFVNWTQAAWRKIRHAGRDRRATQALLRDGHPYFLVPLQVHDDSQIIHHSPFPSVDAFVVGVLESFASAAPPDCRLVIKQHPLDRGHVDYTALVVGTAARLGCAERVLYIRDGHLPTLLPGARGTVTVNSTVGLSSLHHGTPVKTLGSAVYDRPGLTAQGSLDEFWRDPPTVDGRAVEAFRHYLARTCQANGSFYTAWRRTGIVGTVVDRMASQYAAALSCRQPSPGGRNRAAARSAASTAPVRVSDETGRAHGMPDQLPAE